MEERQSRPRNLRVCARTRDSLVEVQVSEWATFSPSRLGSRLRLLSRSRTGRQKLVGCSLLVLALRERYPVDELREIIGFQIFTNRPQSLGDISSQRVYSALIRCVLIR